MKTENVQNAIALKIKLTLVLINLAHKGASVKTATSPIHLNQNKERILRRYAIVL